MGDHLSSIVPALAAACSAVAISLGYVLLAVRGRREWPRHRVALWVIGVAAALIAVAGPIADAAHGSFPAHMVGHILLGMLAPLLLVLAAPVTLLLRSLPVASARRLSAVLRSPAARVLVHPVPATVLNVGGMWLLYTTGLYRAMTDSVWVMGLVHAHVLLAGYLFTASIVGVDPSPHRKGFGYRSVALVAAVAGHGILAKYLFAHPPAGVPVAQAEVASPLMYYAGGAVEAAVIIALGAQWYAGQRERGDRRVGLGTTRRDVGAGRYS